MSRWGFTAETRTLPGELLRWYHKCLTHFPRGRLGNIYLLDRWEVIYYYYTHFLLVCVVFFRKLVAFTFQFCILFSYWKILSYISSDCLEISVYNKIVVIWPDQLSAEHNSFASDCFSIFFDYSVNLFK